MQYVALAKVVVCYTAKSTIPVTTSHITIMAPKWGVATPLNSGGRGGGLKLKFQKGNFLYSKKILKCEHFLIALRRNTKK